ncbi:MAG TPA: ribokinase, partial [Clostridiales bacterium]|nr:ribokinase [Clostridiales bacterium]
MSVKIAILGSINRDFVASASRLPKLGETVEGFGLSINVGGKGSNQAVQAASLGAKTWFIGCVGGDENGGIVKQSLADRGVIVDFLKELEGKQTGNCSIYVDRQGDNMLVYYPGANKMITTEHLDSAAHIIEGADILITQNEINRDALIHGLKIARKAGVPTLFNPAPATPTEDIVFENADYVTPNETESEVFTGLLMKDIPFVDWKKRNAEWFLKKGVRGVCITLGGKGAYYCDGTTEMDVPAFSVNPVDTTAAGDAFNAGFAYGISAGMEIGAALRLASACGALATERAGAHASIRSKREIDA